MPGEQSLQTDLRIGGAVSARKFNAAMREVEILSRLRAGPGIRITRNRSGMSIQATRQEGRRGGGQPGGIPLVAFVLQRDGVFGDHIVCNRRDGTGNDVVILKEELIRQSMTGTTITRRGISVELTVTSTGTPTNQDMAAQQVGEGGLFVETWNVMPSWEADDIIWAAPIAESDRVELPSSVGTGVDTGPDGDGFTLEVSGPVTPKWIEVRGRWWAAQRLTNITV